jgi:hypothetical protein
MITYFGNSNMNLTRFFLHLKTILELSFNITWRSCTSKGAITIQHAKKGFGSLKKNQNLINIYVLPFKTLAIMASFFFIHTNIKDSNKTSI